MTDLLDSDMGSSVLGEYLVSITKACVFINFKMEILAIHLRVCR